MSEIALTKEDINFAGYLVGQIKSRCEKEDGSVDLLKMGLLMAYINYIINYASTITVLNKMINNGR